jgi:undecaprenyl-diphosphatase
MSTLEAFILGLIQGATEFLPVSSSGHLVIAETLFGITDHNLAIALFYTSALFLPLWRHIGNRYGT